jgi:hypothetical protein
VRKIILITLGLILLTCYAYTEVNLTKKIITPDGIIFYLPEDWVQIPRAALDAYSEAVRRMNPNAKSVHNDYGFQLQSSTNQLYYPYIFVQIKNVGKPPVEQLEQYKTLQDGMIITHRIF